MTAIAIILFAALVAGYPFHRRAVRRAATQAEVRAELRDSLYAETVANQRATIGYLDERVARLKDDAEWARIQAVLHDERHTCLPTLEGIRAGASELHEAFPQNVVDFERRNRW